MRPRVVIDARKARDFGIGRYITGLLGGLARTGTFDLVAIVRPEDSELLPAGVTPLSSGARNYSLGELASVRWILGRLRPDLFHAPHYVVPLLPPPATVVTIHDVIHLQRPEHASLPKQLYARTMIRRAVRSAAAVVTGSRAALADLTGFVPEAAAKAVVIPYGLEEAFRADPTAEERARVRRKLGLPARFVLFLGNDKPHKNLRGLLDAFALLGKDGVVEQRLVLAGGARERAEERRRAVLERGLGDAVVDVGVLPDTDVAPVMSEADALVLPSFIEGFGLPVLEAQALGVPTVCSRRGGLPEAGGDAALYVDPDDPSSIAGALHRILGDDALRGELRALGRRRARAFTWDGTAASTAEVYLRVLAERRAGRP